MIALTLACGSASIRAFDEIPSAIEAEQLGLVVHWRAQTERTRLGTGKTGIALWAHSAARKQEITIKVGDRVVERIDANGIDVAAAQAAAQTSMGAYKTKPLGIEAARKLADTIVARYAKIGRKAEKFEIDQPLTYLVAASNDGAIQSLNAETGETLWTNAVGDYRLPSLGPGVNDQYVTLINGKDMYVFDLMTGRVLGKRRLSESASSAPQPIGSLIYVPGIIGTLHAYEGDDFEADPITLRFSGTLTSSVTASTDRRFVAWPNKNHVYIAQAGRRLTLWSRLESSASFRSLPQPTADGFVTVASNGMVYRTNLSQFESIVWRQNLATQVTIPPLVARGLVLVVSDIGDGYALDEESGEVRWTCDATDIRNFLAVTEKRVYAQRKAGQLVSIDRATGKVVGSLNRAYARGVVNTINDRVFLESETGSILCLREPEAVEQTINYPSKSSEKVAKKDTAGEPGNSLDAPAATMPAPTDSLFGEPPAADPASPAMIEDPFAPAPSSDKPAFDPLNPFGT